MPHYRFLIKLYMYGMTGTTHRLIEHFLGNRIKRLLLMVQNQNVEWLNRVYVKAQY